METDGSIISFVDQLNDLSNRTKRARRTLSKITEGLYRTNLRPAFGSKEVEKKLTSIREKLRA